MIVGFTPMKLTRGVTTMAETKSMTAEQVVGYLLEGDGLDLRVSRFPGSCSGCWRRRCRSWLAVLTVSERRRSA